MRMGHGNLVDAKAMPEKSRQHHRRDPHDHIPHQQLAFSVLVMGLSPGGSVI